MTGTLQIRLESSWVEEMQSVPVVVGVLDKDLESVVEPETFLVTDHPTFDLEPGAYVVHVDLPSGRGLRRTVSVEAGDQTTASFQLHDLSGHEALEKAAVLGGLDLRPEASGLDAEEYASAWVKLWRWAASEDEWRLMPFVPRPAWHDRDGVRYTFSLEPGRYFLQVGGPHVAWRHVAVPPHENATVTVLPDRDRPGELLVSAATGDDVAESLLGYLRSSQIAHAEKVISRAEHLLFGKFQDPIAATVAGYYLLRVKRFERLRDWAPNLARYFEWLPDGAIIDAWQHIQQARETGAEPEFGEAREQLLLAASRGLPVYTEGLRLLVDGLSLFSAPDDPEVRRSLQAVSRYADAADWTAPTVTFRGLEPERPEPSARFGLPRSTAGMVFLQRVELADLVRIGMVEPDTRVRFAQAPRVTARVTDRGSLELRSGARFRDPDDAAKAAASRHEPWLFWGDWRVESDRTLASVAHGARQRSARAEPDDPIERLGLSTRTANVLHGAGFTRVQDVIRGYQRLDEIHGIGERSVAEITSALSASDLPVDG